MNCHRLVKVGFHALLLFGLNLSLAKPVHASTVLFSDDFSQGLAKWQPTRDNGSRWSMVNGRAEGTIVERSTISEMVPKDEFWQAGWKNLEYEFQYFPQQGGDRNISFGFLNLNNWYDLHFVNGAGYLTQYQNGRVVQEIMRPASVYNGGSYTIKIQFREGHIKATVNGEIVFDEKQASFTGANGKIGIKMSTGSVAPTKVAFDNLVVRELTDGDMVLPISVLKQSNPTWKDEEYDTATKWSDRPTIGRWGCAMTSVAMIMRYHGLTKLPDGSEVTPSTLNAWLKTQPDGYLGEGALNWLAVTRLTRLISQQYGTVKLEYTRHNGASSQTAITQLLQQKPVILEIAGHFLVGSGVNADKSDLYISDPAYTYTQFSQHKTSLLSTRAFHPSHTDLSALWFGHKPGLDVTIRRADGQALTDLDQFEDVIRDTVEGSGEQTPRLLQKQLMKPAAGTYLVDVSQSTLQPYQLEIWSYDLQAEPTKLTQTGLVGPQALSYHLSYDPAGQAQIKPAPYGFAELRRELPWLKQQKHVSTTAVVSSIDRLASLAEKATPGQQRRYAAQIRAELAKSQRASSANGRAYLEQQLKRVEAGIKP